MEHDDFSGDISSDDFSNIDEHHEHEPKREYINKSQWHLKIKRHGQVLP